MGRTFGRIRTTVTLTVLAASIPFALDALGLEDRFTETLAGLSAPDAEGQMARSEDGESPTEQIDRSPGTAVTRQAARSTAPKPSGEALQCGKASYYSDALAGKETASGEPYAPQKYTGAHRLIPLGTTVLVVRQDDKRSVEVVINDRGPFSPDKIIDISRAAAEDIGLIRDGVTQVCLYVIKPR